MDTIYVVFKDGEIPNYVYFEPRIFFKEEDAVWFAGLYGGSEGGYDIAIVDLTVPDGGRKGIVPGRYGYVDRVNGCRDCVTDRKDECNCEDKDEIWPDEDTEDPEDN